MRSSARNFIFPLVLLVLTPALPQAPTPQEDLTFRISANLVQLDAIVTGPKGERPRDLTSQDFRILLDGKPQPIRLCEFVDAGGHPTSAALKAALPPELPRDKRLRQLEASRPYMPASAPKAEDVRRTVVLFVDDFNLSAESVPNVRTGLRRFIENQLLPGDLVAVVRASAGLGALQDFTQDRRMLLSAAEQVRWNPNSSLTQDAYTVFGRDPMELLPGAGGSSGDYNRREELINRAIRASLNSASSLRRLIHGMASLPGRKSVIILADRMPLATPDELMNSTDNSAATGSGIFGGSILSSMRRVIDESTRSGVALYAIDTRGMNSLTLQAADKVRFPHEGFATATSLATPTQDAETGTATVDAGDYVNSRAAARRNEHIENQWGGIFLTTQTGGFMVTESNRIDTGLARIAGDQQGYYVLGFTPANDVLEPDEHGTRVFHRVKIEVLRPGLKIRAHGGFFGISDEQATQMERVQRPAILTALESPFQSQGVGVEVRSAFLNAKRNRWLLHTEVTIDGRTLKLTGPPQHLSGIIHLLAHAFAVSGEQLPGGIDQMLRVDLDAEGYERALKYGLVYTTVIEVPRPGPYQIRVACSDESTGKIGTASDFVEAPQIKGRNLVLSGLVFAGNRGGYDVVVPAAGPAYFKPGQKAAFVVQLIRAPGVAASSERGLSMRVRLFRDAEQLYAAPAQPVVAQRKNAGQFFTRGEVELPAGLSPGEYLLRVDVEDTTSKKPQLAWRWARVTVRVGE